MSLDEMINKPLRRLNPYRGLVIDVPTWSAAHDYHNTQRRLHNMGMHQAGVVTGLEVVGWNPPDGSVVIYPGIAVDHDGNTIIVGEPQRFQIQMGEAGILQLVIQYREVADEMAHTGEDEESHALYMLEAYRLEARLQIPEEDYIELARIQISGSGATVVDAQNPLEPLLDEVDLRYRTVAGPKPTGQVAICLVPLETTPNGAIRHQAGALSLIRNINATTEYRAEFKGQVNLNQEISGCQILLMAGQEEFTLAKEWDGNLRNYLDRGGIIFGECCGPVAGKQESPFQKSFREMAGRLGRPLEPLERRHPVFTANHLFGEPPEGVDGPAAMFGSGGIIYSDGDYGCLWDGGREEKAAPRSAIRSGLELGVNLAVYSYQQAHSYSVRMVNRRTEDPVRDEEPVPQEEPEIEEKPLSQEEPEIEEESETVADTALSPRARSKD